MSHFLRLTGAALCALILSGCATYGASLTGAIEDLQKGDYVASEAKLQQALKPTGGDRLLHYLELGVVKHLQGDFAASNALLETAGQIAERSEEHTSEL